MMAILQSISIDGWNILLAHDTSDASVITAKQVHGKTIIAVPDCVPQITQADGLIGVRGDVPFGIRTADCMPLILITDSRVLALHMSRKTLVAGILDEVVQQLDNEKIKSAYIGPHICEQCFSFLYEGEEIQNFAQLFPYAVQRKNGIVHLSLLNVITRFLESRAVSLHDIIRDTRCTFETAELCSYRRWRLHGNTGKFSQIVIIVQ